MGEGFPWAVSGPLRPEVTFAAPISREYQQMTTTKTKLTKNAQRAAQAQKTPVAKGTRRVHSEAFKQKVLAECTQEGVTINAVAMRHKLSRSLVQKWRATAKALNAPTVTEAPVTTMAQAGTMTPLANKAPSVSQTSKGTVVELQTLRSTVVQLQALRSAMVDRETLRATVKRLEIEKELLKDMLKEALTA